MTWALRRQFFYTGILILLFLGFGYMIISPYINKSPTCMDYKQNGDEEGIDCGGSCIRACSFQVDEVSVLWARAFKVVPGRYNAVAYIENHNRDAAIYKIKYRFRFSDKDNIYVGKREGEAFIGAGGKTAVFEQAIDVGNSIPVYTSFEFTEPAVWSTVPDEKLNQVKVLISNIVMQEENIIPRLSATVENSSFLNIPDLNVVAILYDKEGNAISASRTYLKELQGEEKRDIYFTWQEPLDRSVVVKELIPVFNIFLVKSD